MLEIFKKLFKVWKGFAAVPSAETKFNLKKWGSTLRGGEVMIVDNVGMRCSK